MNVRSFFRLMLSHYLVKVKLGQVVTRNLQYIILRAGANLNNDINGI